MHHHLWVRRGGAVVDAHHGLSRGVESGVGSNITLDTRAARWVDLASRSTFTFETGGVTA